MTMADNPRIEELRRRVQSDPASIAFAALAEEYRRIGRFDDAIATCTAGLKRHPSYLSARVTLGRALMEVGRYEDAQEELEFVLRAAPENLAAIRGLAEIHHRSGEGMDAAGSGPSPAADMPPASMDPTGLFDAVPARSSVAAAPAQPFDEPAPDPVLHAQLQALENFLGVIERARTAADRP